MKQRFVVILDIETDSPYASEDISSWIESAMTRTTDRDIQALVFTSTDDLIADAWDRNFPPVEVPS